MAPKKNNTSKKAPKQATLKKTITKKATPAKKATTTKKTASKKTKAAAKSPTKKPVAKKAATTKKKPAPKANSGSKAGKKSKKGAEAGFELTLFTEVLLDVCKLVTLCCRTAVDDTDANLKKYRLVHTDDFSAAKPVLDLLPEDARFPMMRLAQAYLEDMRREADEEDEEWDFDSEEEEEDDELEEEEDDDAERTAAILEEYARELDDDDDGDFLFGGDIMSSFHFVQFKQVFTQAEAKKLLKDYAEGGKLDKAMDKIADQIYAEDDEDYEQMEADLEDEDEEDEEDFLSDEDEFEPQWKR